MTGGRRTFQRVLVIAFTAALMTAAQAARIEAQPLPTLTDAAVNDFANVVDPAAEAEIDRWVRSLIRASKDYVYVVTVDTYAPFGSIEEYAVRLFEHAKIGTRAKDNGALIVLAVKDRRVRIETGYGLEEFISDGFAGETIRQVMLPEFREGRYGQGLLNGVTRIVQQNRRRPWRDALRRAGAGGPGDPAAAAAGVGRAGRPTYFHSRRASDQPRDG